jgi:hypothetical protein
MTLSRLPVTILDSKEKIQGYIREQLSPRRRPQITTKMITSLRLDDLLLQTGQQLYRAA